ncbi:ATP-binding protein [Actinophytocola sp. KF-1]
MPTEGAHSDDPGLSGDNYISRTLDGAATSEVRRLLRDLLSGHGGVIADDAVLVADELVSNALQHGGAPRSCRMFLTGDGARLRIEVDDSSPRDPEIRTPDHTGGRGLILVDRLASRWGFDRHVDHKTVWAELTLNTPGSSGHAPHLSTARTWSSLRTPHQRPDRR